MNEQMGDLLELAGLGDVENVVAAIMQVVSGAADRVQSAVLPGDHALIGATDFLGAGLMSVISS